MEKYLHQDAIIEYVQFMRSVVNLKDNPEDETTKQMFESFYHRYDELRGTPGIESKTVSILNNELCEIYYIDEPQLFAFIHIVIEEKAGKKFSKSFGEYTKDDFMEIKKTLKSVWYSPLPDDEPEDFVYLEDEENTVDAQTKTENQKIRNKILANRTAGIQKLYDVTKYTFQEEERQMLFKEMKREDKKAYIWAKNTLAVFDNMLGSIIDELMAS